MVFIHPFSNGNGRTARLTALFFLMKANPSSNFSTHFPELMQSSEKMRTFDVQILENSYMFLTNKYRVGEVPIIMRRGGAGTRDNIANRLLSLAYVLTMRPTQVVEPVVHEERWEPSLRERVYQKYNQIAEEIVLHILETEEYKRIVFNALFG